MNTSRSFLSSACALAVLAGVSSANASVSYSSVGSLYTQNFNSLPSTPENASLGTTLSGAGWVDDSASPGAGQYSIVGWYLYHPIDLSAGEGGVNGHQRIRIGTGSSNVGSFWSYGVSGNADRALGSLASNTLENAGVDQYMGLRLSNNTGQTLYSFTLSYTGEQWRDGGAATPVAQSLVFMWSTTATAISDPNSAFNTVGSLGFTSPVAVNTGGGAAVVGNTAGQVLVNGVTVEGIEWLPGTDLWLRWNDVNNSGNDHGLALDDISFTAQVPEPSTFVLAGLGAAALLAFRRRK